MTASPRPTLPSAVRIWATDGARSNLTWASVPPVKSMSYRSPPCATIDAMPMRVMVIETM